MARMRPSVLVLNRGSSSLKRACFTFAPEPDLVARETVAADSTAATDLVLWLDAMRRDRRVVAIGHRVVHGGTTFTAPTVVTDAVREELNHMVRLAPNHLPDELALIDAVRGHAPTLPQVVAFDTSFHQSMPAVVRRLPIPVRFDDAGVRAYGFHGLSYSFLMGQLERAAGSAAAEGRVVLAHLGSGSSLAAVRHRRSIDTTMTFTPTGGVIMSTRSGDVDPGLLAYLARTPSTTQPDVERLLSQESGLLGLSGTTGDMRALLEREDGDPRARLAVDIYCYRIRKTIGAYAAALGGLDTVVFAGGIGEHAPIVRARICEDLEFLGIEIDPALNARDAAVISTDRARVTVRIIPTDEELMIARAVYSQLASGRH